MKKYKLNVKTGMASDKQLLMLIVICKKLGVSYEQYQNMFMHIYGVNSINYITAQQAQELIYFLRIILMRKFVVNGNLSGFVLVKAKKSGFSLKKLFNKIRLPRFARNDKKKQVCPSYSTNLKRVC